MSHVTRSQAVAVHTPVQHCCLSFANSEHCMTGYGPNMRRPRLSWIQPFHEIEHIIIITVTRAKIAVWVLQVWEQQHSWKRSRGDYLYHGFRYSPDTPRVPALAGKCTKGQLWVSQRLSHG